MSTKINLVPPTNHSIGAQIPIQNLVAIGMTAKQEKSTHIVILPGASGEQDVLVTIKVPKRKKVFTYLREHFASIKQGIEFRLLPVDSFEKMVKIFHPEAKAYYNAD